ncbi:MAG TPA: MCE family protein, partial [Acidimicrobiales bacterium]|nr:MCE family protein [Acidimicrobiales bacterium]
PREGDGLTVASPPAPAPTEAPTGPVSAPRTWSWRLIALGVALVLFLVGIVVLVFSSFGGSFSSYAVAEAQLPASSTAVALSSPVEYRNVTVGTVASQGKSVPGGLVLVTVHLDPSQLHAIPAGVRATETPVSFFGDPYIELVPPAHIGKATLRPGATIPALTGQTASLQATLGDLDNLLTELHPAELDAALTAVAGALAGNGTSLGHNFVRGNAYFQQMESLWPTVVSNLNTFVPVANQFAASTTDILQILANQTTTAQTVNNEASGVRQSITGGVTLVGETSQLLAAIQQPYNVLAADSGPFLKDISQSPKEISQLLSGLDAWARAWSAAEASGPYLSLTDSQFVANPADLGLAVLGGPQAAAYLSGGLGPGFVNPPTYTSSGAIVTSASSRAGRGSTFVSDLTSSTSQVMAAPAEVSAISQIVTALKGSPPSSPAVSTLLLSPILEQLVTQP